MQAQTYELSQALKEYDSDDALRFDKIQPGLRFRAEEAGPNACRSQTTLFPPRHGPERQIRGSAGKAASQAPAGAGTRQ